MVKNVYTENGKSNLLRKPREQLIYFEEVNNLNLIYEIGGEGVTVLSLIKKRLGGKSLDKFPK